MILDEPPVFTALCDEHPRLRFSLRDTLLYARMRNASDAKHFRSQMLLSAANEGRPLYSADPMVPSVVADLIQARAGILDLHRRLESWTFTGRIIAYWWQYTLSDGCSPIESNNFLDVDDCPPWNTWLGTVPMLKAIATRQHRANDAGPALLAWVPSAFVDGCQRAIEVNSSNCIRWIEDVRWR